MITYRLYMTAGMKDEDAGFYHTLLDAIKEKHGIGYGCVDITTLNDAEKEQLVEDLRIISRKNGIGVVSKGSGVLPISRRKKLGKICILLKLENGQVTNVYPHEINKKRIDIASHLKRALKASSMNEIMDHSSISEQDIARMISTFPELIEEGLEFVDTEVETEGGKIDAVFKSMKDEHLLIEIEIEARDNAIGQVQRFVTYSEKYNIPREKIRLGIVCARIADSRLKACIGAGIEVYVLGLEKKNPDA
ncbi:MAG: hypothetical protein A4E24_02039 [Methanomethylovorans sp. PtaU1.Bin093]|nr:MAG: hypothetical protein A4E24_02039 [Methanomethylovorans sp. PtaU1.Bin093]